MAGNKLSINLIKMMQMIFYKMCIFILKLQNPLFYQFFHKKNIFLLFSTLNSIKSGGNMPVDA